MNKTIIIGRVATAVQLQDEVSRFTITSSREFNEQQSDVDFEVIVTGKQAMIAYKHIRRGDLCCVEGTLSMQNKITITADRITFLNHK